MFSRLKIKTNEQGNWDVKHHQNEPQEEKDLAQEVAYLTVSIRRCFNLYIAIQIAAMTVAFVSQYLITKLKG